jgi:TonB family protein
LNFRSHPIAESSNPCQTSPAGSRATFRESIATLSLLMKSTPIAFCCLLGALFVAGCHLDAFSDSGRGPGKPVVVLASVSEANGSARDLTPHAPYSLPDYPPPLLQAGMEGFVDVRLGVRPDGSVKDTFVLKSTETDFQGPVLLAVKTWQFPDLKRESTDPNSTVEIVCRIRFSIEQYWRDSIGGDLGGRPDRGGAVSSDPSRSHEMKTP